MAPEEHEQDEERRGAQELRGDHEVLAAHAVGEQTGGQREQQERQRVDGLQRCGLLRRRAERDDGGDRNDGDGHLLAELRGKARVRETTDDGLRLRMVHDPVPEVGQITW